MKNKLLFFIFFLFTFMIVSYDCSFTEAQSIKADSKVLLKSKVYFEFSKSELTPASVHLLSEIVALLKVYPKNLLVIEGHSDNVGEKQYNRKLSDARAKAVFDFIVEKGVENYRIKIVHYGDQKPLNTSLTESERAANRRAELIIFKGD